MPDPIRQQIGRLGAYESWARTEDRPARTAPARQAMLDKFERKVDPLGELSKSERAKRAEFARKAHFIRLALKSAQVRKARAATREPREPRETPEARLAKLDALAAGGLD